MAETFPFSYPSHTLDWRFWRAMYNRNRVVYLTSLAVGGVKGQVVLCPPPFSLRTKRQRVLLFFLLAHRVHRCAFCDSSVMHRDFVGMRVFMPRGHLLADVNDTSSVAVFLHRFFFFALRQRRRERRCWAERNFNP